MTKTPLYHFTRGSAPLLLLMLGGATDADADGPWSVASRTRLWNGGSVRPTPAPAWNGPGLDLPKPRTGAARTTANPVQGLNPSCLQSC